MDASAHTHTHTHTHTDTHTHVCTHAHTLWSNDKCWAECHNSQQSGKESLLVLTVLIYNVYSLSYTQVVSSCHLLKSHRNSTCFLCGRSFFFFFFFFFFDKKTVIAKILAQFWVQRFLVCLLEAKHNTLSTLHSSNIMKRQYCFGFYCFVSVLRCTIYVSSKDAHSFVPRIHWILTIVLDAIVLLSKRK